MRIDAHQHFWAPARGDYGWLTPALGPLYRDVGPRELVPHLRRHGIDGTVLVQAAPTVAETRYLLAIAAAHDVVRGVVGWADLAAPDAAGTIDALADDPRLCGLRPMLQDLPRADWIATAPIDAALRRMVDRGLAFDALVRPAHLPHLLRCLERNPDLRVVVDHAAKPEIAAGRCTDWRTGLAALAARPGVHCKLSGLLTEAAPGAGAAALRPYVDTVFELFGPERVMWGSDWPVLELAAGYDDWIAITDDLLRDLDASQRAGVLGTNAARVYRLR